MKKQTKRTWLLKLTDSQFNCIIRGMEFYHRVMCGQVEELNYIVGHRIKRETLNEVKNQLFPELRNGENYGWDGGYVNKFVDAEQAQSYQIYREMRHQDVLLKGNNNVYTSDTLQTSKADKLIVERIKD